MMAGAYCRYCDRRCFVYRQVWADGQLVFSGHLATCPRGKRHDRESFAAKFGPAAAQDADTAYNPSDPSTWRVEMGGGMEPWRVEVGGGMFVEVDESLCIVLSQGDRRITITDVGALTAALQLARLHAAALDGETP